MSLERRKANGTTHRYLLDGMAHTPSPTPKFHHPEDHITSSIPSTLFHSSPWPFPPQLRLKSTIMAATHGSDEDHALDPNATYIAVIGSSGIGKTTLISCFTGEPSEIVYGEKPTSTQRVIGRPC